MILFGRFSHILYFKPYPGLHIGIFNRLYCLIKSLREQLLRDIIVSHHDIPGNPLFLIPSAVYDKIGKSPVFYHIQNTSDILVGRTSPCSAVLVKDNGQSLLTFRPRIHISFQCTRHSLGNPVHTAAPCNGQNSHRTQKKLSGF